MIYTLEQIDQLTKESVRRENALIAEYRRTHTVPGSKNLCNPCNPCLKNNEITRTPASS